MRVIAGSGPKRRVKMRARSEPRTPANARSTGARELSVSAIETYLTCPFKFFAQRVLKLEEERDDEEVMDPKAQGLFVHDVFECFFHRWQDAGRRTIAHRERDGVV